MKMNGVRAFGVAFCITAAVLGPLIYALSLLVSWQEEKIQQEQVAKSEWNILKTQPKAEHQFRILVCIAGQTPSFGLLSLDAPNNEIIFAPLPAEGVLINGDATPTLAESYQAAGPARVANLLSQTLAIELPYYLALPEDRLPDLLEAFGNVRVGLSGALSSNLLGLLGIDGAVKEWHTAEIQSFLGMMQEKITPSQYQLTPETLASTRAAFWESWLRDKLPQLPTQLPDGLRGISSSILSNLSATDLYTLGDTLEFLANQNANIITVPLEGNWNRNSARYEFTDATLASLSAFASEEASDAQSDSSSAP